MKLFRETIRGRPQDFLQLVNLVVFGLAILMIGLSLAQTLIRFSLPMDGWSYARDLAGTSQRLVFDQNMSKQLSSIYPGDVLIAIEGRPIEQILSEALKVQPQRPENWAVGQSVQYTVRHSGRIITVGVPLLHLSPGFILGTIGLNSLRNPAPLLMLIIGLVVYIRKPSNSAARLLLLFSAAVFSSTGISQGVTGTNVIGPAEMFYRNTFWPTQVFNDLIWPFLIAPLYLHLFLLFPVTKAPLRLHPRLTLFGLYAWMPALTLLAALLHRGDPLGFWMTWSILSLADFVLVLILGVLIMVHTLATARGGTAQAQIRWIVFGAVVTSLSALAGNLLVGSGAQGEILIAGWFASRLLLLALPVAMAIAILRYHLFDIDIFINRTLVYGSVTLLLGAVYFASVIVFQFAFRAITQENSQPAVVFSTLAIAVLFNPLRNRVQDFINSRFYRRRYDAARALKDFSKNLAFEVEPEKLIGQMLKVVEDTIQPETISLWLMPIKDTRHE